MQGLHRNYELAQLGIDSIKLRTATAPKAKAAAKNLVARRLGKLRGLPQKVGQMMATADLTAESGEFDSLYEDTNPLPWDQIRAVLSEVWIADPNDVIRFVEPQGRAASLGQVHKAELVDGNVVAIKVQFPGIQEEVKSDLSKLNWLASPFGGFAKGFDLENYQATLKASLERELDYRQEATMQMRFVIGPGKYPHVRVPRVDRGLSSQNVLVSEWIDGETWNDVQSGWNVEDQQELGRRLLEWMLSSLFEHGLVHADLHPGNIRFARSMNGPQIVLYDFGSVYEASKEERIAWLRLIESTRNRNKSPLPLLGKLGFNTELLSPFEDRLPELCRVLLEPFCHRGPYKMSQWQISSRLNQLLGDDRMNFRIAGPPRLVYLLRAFHLVSAYIRELNAEVDWYAMMEPLLKKYRSQIDGLDVSAGASTPKSRTLAKYLKIRVTRDGVEKAKITMPASAVDRIETLLDPDTIQKIAEANIDLECLLYDIRQQGYAPGLLFKLDQPEREVSVWLE